MDFYAELDQAVDLVRQRGRVTYRALKDCLGLDDDRLDALRAELSYSHRDRVVDDGRGLVWTSPVDENGDTERRQLTVLFCDLVDSTPLSTRLDPEDLREVMRAYYRTCGDVIAHFDGYIAQYLGDGLVVFFGFPHAHEDDAQRAVRAGLRIIQAIAALNVDLTESHGVQLAVRLGCHTGLVVVGEVVGELRHELMALGDTPNIAARLQGVAPPNGLVIGPVTHRLVDGYFSCRSLGAPPLKGVSAPLEVFEVLHESDARSRLEALGTSTLTPLIGRDDEMAFLRACWAETVDGHGRTVLITGEAGIGKSRLVHALIEHAAADNAWSILLQGSPYHRDTAFHPVIDLFERVVLDLRRLEEPSDKRRKLEEFFEQSGLPLEDSLAHICAMLSIPPSVDRPLPDLPPEELKSRTLQALQSIVLRRSQRQPVLLVVEDLQWVDPSTLELISMLIERVPDSPVLVLSTCRPDHPSPWPETSKVLGVDISRLSTVAAGELVRRVADGKVLPDEIVSELVARTDGVPLFIEELTKTVLESGVLDEQRRGEPLPPQAIPNTLHDSLMARLDRLHRTKGLAQLGATIGREFSYSLLRAVSPWAAADLNDGLARLVAAEFLQQQGTPPDATYRFKHALIQDAAYQSVLKATRQQHHRRIAQTLQEQFHDVVDHQPELLAHHYTEACLVEEAIPYWRSAAQRAFSRHAVQEAANHAGRGLRLLATLPRSRHRAEVEQSLRAVLGPSLFLQFGPHAVEENYARLYELARDLDDTTSQLSALAGLSYAKIARGELRRARALAEEYLVIAARQPHPLLLSEGHSMLAYTAWWQGDVAVTCEHSRDGVTLYEAGLHRAGVAGHNQNPRILSGYLLGLSQWVLGYPTRAVTAMEETLAYARELEHTNSIAVVLLFSAQLAQLRREPGLAESRAEEGLAIATEQGIPAVSLWCLLPRGWARAQQGDVAAGIADIRDAIEQRRALGMGAVWPWFLALLAEALGAHGEYDEGLRTLEEAQQWVARTDERLYAAEMNRIRGEILLRLPSPDPVEAQRCFETALDLAREQRAKSWELRAAISMARMWMQRNRIGEARELLQPVYAWFTEGLDTADLREARELLDQLS